MHRTATDGFRRWMLMLAVFAGGCMERPPEPSPSANSDASRQAEIVQNLANDKWLSLIHGQDLAGWEHLGGGTIRIAGEMVYLENDASHRPGYLATTARFLDFQARFRCKVIEGDSGLFFRAHRDPNHPEGLVGPQVQLHALPGRGLGGLFETQGRGWLVKPGVALETQVLGRSDWLDGEVTVRGTTVRVVLNGVVTAEWDDPDPARGNHQSGCLAIQMHGAGCRVIWASLEVRAVP